MDLALVFIFYLVGLLVAMFLFSMYIAYAIEPRPYSQKITFFEFVVFVCFYPISFSVLITMLIFKTANKMS